MKKIYLLLAVVLIAFSSCDRDEEITNPEQKNDLSEYCGCEVRSKMSDVSEKTTNYYLSLQNADTTFYNVVVSKKLFNQYDLGSIIECEEEEVNVTDFNTANAKTEGGYKVVNINGKNYLVIELEDNISVNDTVKTNEQKE